MNALGRYRLDHVLGSGSFATVWRGYDPELDVVVAVKVLADNWSLDADVRERFLAEARLLRRISSDRVVRVHDVGVVEGRPYFVMDHVAGGSLADRVGTLAPAEAVRLTAEAAYAVQVVHDAGVVHRDVKPGNLLLDTAVDPPRVLLADLGSAKTLADASGYTVTTGTPAYMAPEQAGLAGGFDGRADVYALAVVGHELLSGVRPFTGEAGSDPTGPGRRVVLAPVAAPRGLPAAVDTVLTRGLAPDPADRPADARQLADALLAALVEPSSPAPRSWPAGAVAAVAVVLFVLGAVVVTLLR